jgi:hypothetical protein
MVFAVNAPGDPNSNKTFDDYLDNAEDTNNDTNTKSAAVGLRVGTAMNLKDFGAMVGGMVLAGMLL